MAVLQNVCRQTSEHPDEILRAIGYFKNPELLANMADADKKHAFMSIQLKGNDDDTILNNYKKVKDSFNIDGIDVKQAVLEKIAKNAEKYPVEKARGRNEKYDALD